MSGSQSSLFAGMNIGESTKCVLTPISSGQNKAEPERKDSQDSNDKAMVHTGVSGRTGGSRFSFIKQSENVRQMTTGNVPEVDVEDKASSVLDLFETLDEGDSIMAGDERLLSYSDQLAEILPMSTPIDDTLISTSDSFAIVENDKAEETLQDHSTADVYVVDFSSEHAREENDPVDFSSENAREEDEIIVGDPQDEDELVNIHAKDFDVSKYDLVLEPEDNLNLFHSQHSFKWNKLRDEKEELEKTLRVLYEDVKNKIVSLENKLNNMRRKFDEVLSSDDYDSAAEINEKIEELTTEKYELQSARSGLLNSKVRAYLNDANVFKEKEVSFHEWALSKYHDLENEQNELLTEHRQACTKEIDTNEQDLKNQKDEVNRTLEHLQLDKEHVERDRTQLDEKINAKLEIFQDRKKELVERQRCLEDEIETMERRLEELKTDSKGVEIAIRNEEDKMKESRKEFEPLETKLKERNEKIQVEEEMLKEKLERVELEEKDIEATAAQDKDKEESLLKNKSDLVAMRTESEALVQTCKKETDSDIPDVFLRELTEQETSNLINVRTLEQEKSTELQALELEVFNMEQKITMKKKRLDEIKGRVPELEKGKKMAATEHNFKEAKRLNEIVKQLTIEAETTKTDVDKMEDDLREERKKVAALKVEYGKLKKDVVTAKESHDLQVFITVLNKIMLLVKEEKRIFGDSLLETLREAELDLLKTEYRFLNVPSQSVISTMSDVDQETVAFVKKFLNLEDIVENTLGPDEIET